jgi:hypothetical protein
MLSTAPSISDWATFFSAEVGAAASLAGLVIVAISINLSRIIAHPHLPGRAVETLAMIVGVWLCASAGLVPGQSIDLLGWEISAIGSVVWLVGVFIQFQSRGIRVPGKKWAPALRAALGQAATLPFVIVGGAVHVYGGNGLYWVVPGVIFCLIAGVMNTWVLLVEIIR